MEGRYEKFCSSAQAAVKLAIAAEDCFKKDTPEDCRCAYGEYLRTRLRPAAEFYVQREETENLQNLWELQCFSPGLLNDLLQLAAQQQKNASYVWLLRKKQETWGFSPRQFRL